MVLVGFMGAGKSSVGLLLAQRMGWDFADLDRQIEARAARTVAEIFADGEPIFRELERLAAESVGERRHCVVAAGGGAFAVAQTRRLLQAGAITVWLRCDLDTALGRIAGQSDRPLAGNRERMRQLLAEREGFYQQADLTVDATIGSELDVANRVWEAVREPLGAKAD